MKLKLIVISLGVLLTCCDPSKDEQGARPESKPATPSREEIEGKIEVCSILVEMMEGNVKSTRAALGKTKDAGPAAMKAEDLRRALDDLEEQKAELAKWEAMRDAAGSKAE